MESTTNTTFLATAGLVGGLLTAASGFYIQAVVQPSSTVPDDRWSYPWSSDAVTIVSIAYVAFHILVALGLLGVVRSGAAGPTRPARVGLGIAITGTLGLLAGEIATLPMADATLDEAAWVGAFFGLGTVLSAIGLVMAGVAALRNSPWEGWRRYTIIGTGVWTTVLVGLAMTKALPSGVALYGVGLSTIFLVLRAETAPAPVRIRLRES